MNLRDYFHPVPDQINFLPEAIENNLHDEKFKHWLEWARKKADWYDPFIDLKDKLLNDVQKDNSTPEKT